MNWISIEEKLPKPHTWVLVACGQYITIGYLSLSNVWKDETLQEFVGHVTHWMPLPKPPNNKNE